MKDYISLYDYAKFLNINKGDIVFVSSDAQIMLYDALMNGSELDLNFFIDGLINQVGNEGTILFPTYNWDFCKGLTFDYNKTPCKTGSLGNAALKRKDFKRTKHPIYSFAVWGKYQDELAALNNIDSFGLDSPFNFLKEKNAVNIIIDVSLLHCFTFVHYVEEHSGLVQYRYIKNFTAGYVDEAGHKDTRTYSMFVRDLNLNVTNIIDSLEEDFISAGAEENIRINNSSIKRIELNRTYPIILNDILCNRSRKICTYNGQ